MKTKSLFLDSRRQAALTLAIIAALLTATGVLAAAGALDPTFDGDGKVVTAVREEDVIHAMVIQSNGKIVVAGESYTSSASDFSLARYNTNGTLDASFDGDGKVITDIAGVNNRANAIALQTDGKIVAAGYDYMGGNDNFALARYNANGSLDGTFDGDGIVVTDFVGSDLGYAVAIQSDGKIVVAGASDNLGDYAGDYNYALARYNTNGSLDTSFDGDGKVITSIGTLDFAYAIAIQPDGKIVVAGESYTGTNYDFSLARYNTNGTLDATFDGDGKVVTDIQNEINHGFSIKLQQDGKIIVGGTTGNDDFALVRYNTNGSPDVTFDSDGIVVQDFDGTEYGEAIGIQPDGKIVMAGYTDRWGANDFALARFNTNGSVDTSFDADGRVITSIGTDDQAYALAIQSDGRIILAGKSDDYYGLARYDAGPQSFRSTGAQDGWILESTENSNTGGTLNTIGGTFILGDSAQDQQYRAVLSFNTAGLPNNAVITKVQISIRNYSVVGTSPFATHGKLWVDIRKPYFGTTAGLVLTDFAAAASSALVGSFSGPPVIDWWYTATLGSAAYSNINLGGITQFRLRFYKDDNDDMGADTMTFYSGNTANFYYRPILYIEYYIP